MNADGVADLVTMTLSGRSVLKQRTRYEIHFGSPTADGIQFSQSADAVFEPRAKTPPGYSFRWFQEVDGDGQADIVHGYIKTGVGQMLRTLLGGSLAVGIEIQGSIESFSTDRAPLRREVRADLDIDGDRDAGFFPSVLVGDVTGDGRSDFLVGKNRETLLVFPTVSGPELLPSEPIELEVAVPGDERNSRLVDLNRDGRLDVLMHHSSTTEPHRVVLLISELISELTSEPTCE